MCCNHKRRNYIARLRKQNTEWHDRRARVETWSGRVVPLFRRHYLAGWEVVHCWSSSLRVTWAALVCQGSYLSVRNELRILRRTNWKDGEKKSQDDKKMTPIFFTVYPWLATSIGILQMKEPPFCTPPPPSTSFLPVIFLIIVYFCSFLSGISYGFSEYLKAEIDVGKGSFVGDTMRNNVIIFSSSTFWWLLPPTPPPTRALLKKTFL